MNYKCLDKCELCPRDCGINRNFNQIGKCGNGNKIKIDLYKLHYFEEPCISGSNGSGTVFFTGCNLNCVFCQNYEISALRKGKEIEVNDLAKIFIELQEQGANNINLVTGFSFIPHIVDAIKIAKNQGLNIPIIYNTSGYESFESLKLLNGYIDVYLPDLKYYYNELSNRLSKCENYFETATKAIKEMISQVGMPSFDDDGMIKKGVIIRHLILPNHIQNSKKVLKWIKENLLKDIYVSIMAQYFPTYKANEYEDINRKLSEKEFEDIENYVYKLNLKNGYIQYLEENEEQYVPKF